MRLTGVRWVKMGIPAGVGCALWAILFGWGLRVGAVEALGESGEKEGGSGGYGNLSIFVKVLQLVRQDYVDESKVGFQALVRSAMKGMVSALDPHSQYLEPTDFKAVQDDTQSRFSGVGIIVKQREGRLMVVSTMEGGPALRAGVQAGDQLMKIGDQLTEKMTVNEAAVLLRGETGGAVKVTFYRASTREVKEVELVREVIRVSTVRDARILPLQSAPETRLGYVRITQFNTPTAEELGKALDQLEAEGMEALVLDLRYNPGGVLNAAVEVASLFLPPNSLVVSTEGRVASQNQTYRTPSNARPRVFRPMAILINHGSASASEILAGALRDLNRAVLVGETTFGKGSVQSVIPLPDGSAVRLTTAKYYTPGRQVIHERGIEPTIQVGISAEQERLLSMKRREELLEEREKKELDGFRDVQLERAVDALRAVVLYTSRVESGGAGTVPSK
jgi:carboxyl-terminal processing protease